jgi:hypothetical protein
MAATSKYLYRDSTSGQVQEAQPITTSAGAGDASKLAQTDSSGRFDASLMPVGITPDIFNANASGALSAGDMVYVTSGGLIARASAAAAGNPAIGFTLLAVTTGNPAVAYFEGRNTAVTGLTVGSRYYLDAATPGAITATPVTGTGKLHQYVGTAISTTSLSFEADDAIVLI